MSRDMLFAIGAGVLSAVAGVAFLSRSTGALLFVYLASLPLFMAGLALGPRKPESQCLKPEYFRPQDASDEVGTFEDTIPLPIE